MVKAMIEIDPKINQVLNIIKAQYALKDKSEAIEKMVEIYVDEIMEPELKPEYVEKMKKRNKEPTVKVKDFKIHFGLA